MNARILSFLVCAILIALLPTAQAQEKSSDLKSAQALLAAGKYREAADAFTKAIALSPNDGSAYQGRGQARVNLKDYAGAIQDYDRAIELYPKSPTLHNLRGIAKNDNGDPKAAMADYARAIELNPRYAAPLTNRAPLRRKAGDIDGATADYDHALEIAPKDEYALLGRAMLRAGIGNNAGALADCNTLIGANPKNASAYFNRGLAREKLGDGAGALEDFRGALALNPAMAAAKTHITALQALVGAAAATPGQLNPPSPVASKDVRLETPATGRTASTAAVSPAKPTPSKVVATVFSAPAQSSRVLAPFKGYAMADPCVLDQARPGVPWDPSASSAGGAVGSAQLGQYEAMLRHTMEGLRLLYGPLAPAEEKNFNAFWAPFFDHPTKEALDYFQQITPLLDEMAVTLSNLDGLLPGMGAALQGTMLAAGDPASGAARVAAVQYQRVKAERARLDDLSRKIAALGNPPDPLAGKCAAHKRHRKAVVKEEDILALVKKARILQYYAYQTPKNASGNIDADLRNNTADYNKQITEWNWQGNTFKYSQQDNGLFNYDSPRQGTGGGNRDEFTGTLSADGKTIEHLSFRNLGRHLVSATAASAPELFWSVDAVNISLRSATIKPDWAEIIYAVKGAAADKSITRIESESKYDFHKDDEVTITFQVGNKPVNKEEMKQAFAALANVVSGINGNATAASAKKEDVAAGVTTQQADKTKSQIVDPENDPKVNAEAIAEHLALAEQTRRDADRWAADAAKETDPDRRKELQSRAAAMAANAQSEKDIAESLRTGTMVHTRTDWDEQQHQAIVSNIKGELAVFDAENKLLANIPKVADMVAGADGVALREQVQNDITDAIHSPDALKKLAAIYGKVQGKVVDQGQQQIAAAQDKVDLWDRRLAVAEHVEMAAGMGVTLGALWAPVEIGTLALGYAGSTGFAEGGVKGATVAVVRSVSSRADVIISAYEGATKIDPATGQPAGAWGAVEGALWSIGTNKALESIGGRIQQAKADYALARQTVGGPGFAPVARAKEGRLKEFDFQTPEQRYKTELEAAKTPDAQAAVNQKHAIQVEREAMSTEKDAARQRAEDAVRKGADPATAKEQYNQELKAIDGKYAAKETRNQEHQEVMKELGFDSSYDKNNTDIKPTGSNPKTAESDMDFTPVGSTPHEAYQKGKAYTEAMKKRGHTIDEYGDRWVDTTSDTTVWKPGFGADKPGSGSFEAETIFGSLPNSDKFATKGGIEWTSSETHTTADPLGAVLANAGKAAGAGLGSSRPSDLHVIGKSAVKAAEAAGIEVDPQLKAQIEALKAHQTPEQAGVVDLGADQATKDRQVKSFLGKVQALMGRAFSQAKAKSDQNSQALERQAAAANPAEAYGIRSKLKAYQAGDEAAIATIAQVSPGLAGEMGRSAKPDDLVLAGPAITLNVGGLTRALAQDRDRETKAPPLAANSSDPAFVDLGKRCTQAAQNCATKLAAAKPGSDEARYLADLKTALEQGGKNPAEAVRMVRGLSGTELPVVLAQLGAPAK
jgi:regulator of sirC expression with transglutaminase-like and TPR domain